MGNKKIRKHGGEVCTFHSPRKKSQWTESVDMEEALLDQQVKEARTLKKKAKTDFGTGTFTYFISQQ